MAVHESGNVSDPYRASSHPPCVCVCVDTTSPYHPTFYTLTQPHPPKQNIFLASETTRSLPRLFDDSSGTEGRSCQRPWQRLASVTVWTNQSVTTSFITLIIHWTGKPAGRRTWQLRANPSVWMMTINRDAATLFLSHHNTVHIRPINTY